MKCTSRPIATFLLLLLLLLALPLAASAENIRLFDPKQGPQALSVTQSGSTLYVMTNEGFYTWSLGDAAITCLVDADTLGQQEISLDSLVFMAEKPMLLDAEHEKIWRYEGGAFALALDYQGTALSVPGLRYEHPIFADGYLFVLARTDETVETRATLLKVDIATGAVTPLPARGIAELAPYGEGLLLGLQSPEGDADFAWAAVTVSTADGTVQGTVATLPQPQDRGIAVGDDNMIYAHIGGNICRWNRSAWEPLRPLTVSPFLYYFGVMEGRYITASYQSLTLWDTDAAATGTALTIRGLRQGFPPDDGFMAQNPDITVQRSSETHFCATEAYTLISQGDTTDLYLISLSSDVETLIDKGYAADLSASAALLTDSARLYPAIAAPLTRSGALYGVPVDCMVWAWATRGDVSTGPLTLPALLAARAAWATNDANTGTPFLTNAYVGAEWTRADWARFVLTQYIMTRSDAAGSVDFATDAFAALLAALQALPDTPAAEGQSGIQIMVGEYAAAYCPTLQDTQAQGITAIPPPVLTAGDTPHVPTRVHAYVLNPLSAHKEAAMRFLEYVAQNRDLVTQALLCPGEAQNELTPSASATLLDLQAQLADMPGRILSAAAEHQAALKGEAAQLEAAIDALNQNPGSWQLSQDELNTYRTQIAPYLDLQLSPLLNDQYATRAQSFTDMLALVEQCAGGLITSGQCVDRLNAITRLLYGESAK